MDTDRALLNGLCVTGQLRVAVTGHQQLGDSSSEAFVRTAFDALCAMIGQHVPDITIYSGLAAGADTLFAESALAHNLRLEAVFAAADIAENFALGPVRDRFNHLCQRSTAIHRLPFASRSEHAYLVLGQWLVDHSDLLIAAWNGLPAVGMGGTGDVVAYAQQQGCPVIHVHPGERRVALLDNGVAVAQKLRYKGLFTSYKA